MTDDEITEAGRLERFRKWDGFGLDAVKADLLAGGQMLVGGPPAVRALAWQWVVMKEQEIAKAEIKTKHRQRRSGSAARLY